MANVLTLLYALLICGFVLFLNTGTTDGQTYSGNTVTVLRSYTKIKSYCACWYRLWGCSWWGYRWVTVYYNQRICAPGWTHNGGYNCNIPICRPNCLNQGRCTNPNVCTCPSTSTGPICGSVTCSYQRPCYPGDCLGGTTCVCEEKFSHVNDSEGCTQFNDPSLEPIITKSLVTLSNVRRVDNLADFMFILDGTNKTIDDVLWINQKTFNSITFEMESTFNQPEDLPYRPNYVHDAKMGITLSRIYIRISSIARGAGNFAEDGQSRDLVFNSTYSCNNGNNGVTQDNPATDKATCNVTDDQFKTTIEHGDWMTLTFQTFSGGFQKLVNIDQQSRPYATRYYRGYEDVTQVRFKFDFRAPTHCSEPNAYSRTCPPGATILDIGSPFTTNAIQPRWLGWVDDLSGIWEYYVEVFRLGPNVYGKLTELAPINPEFSALITHNERAINYTSYTPTEPGMYSVLMETRDVANNSRTSRRFVLYDPISKVEINKGNDSRLYVASAVAETGYTWQTGPLNDTNVQFRLRWSGHFVNKFHDEGMLLNAILHYPVQFKNIQDEGILSSEKFVNESLDAPTEYIEGQRTRAAIPNFHGIVKFETGKVLEENDTEPEQWDPVQPLAEERTITLFLRDGDKVRLWVRATDIMGNKMTDKTIVGIDQTAPTMSESSNGNEQHSLSKNVKDSSFAFSSNVKVVTSDPQSGVYRIDFKIWMTINGQEFLHSQWSEDAHYVHRPNPNCIGTFGNRCFIPQQSIDIDNCRFIVNTTDLDHATARLEVAGVNQALLSTSTNFTVGPVKQLDGLAKYSSPTNVRVEDVTASSVRVNWDLKGDPSCYTNAVIVIVVSKTTPTEHEVEEVYFSHGSAKGYDIQGLEPDTSYLIKFSVKGIEDSEVDLEVQTDCAQSPNVENGFITYERTSNGLVAKYNCNTGFEMNDDKLATKECTHDGSWSRKIPRCVIKVKTGEECLADVTDDSQCLSADASCRFDTTSGTFRCLCSEENIFSTAKAKCLKKSGYGGTCHIREQCITFMSECIRTGPDKGNCGCALGTSYNETEDECTTKGVFLCPAGEDRMERWWNKTRLLTTVYQQCPEGSYGQIFRTCKADGTFSDAFYNCTKTHLKHLNNKILQGNISTTAVLESLRDKIRGFKNCSIKIYAGDADILQELLKKITEKQADEATTVEQLTKNAESFFDIVSFVTDPEIGGPIWKSKLEQTNKGAEDLIETIDRYSLNLGKIIESSNQRKLTIRQENLVVSVSKMSEGSDEDLKYPDEGELPSLNFPLTSSFTLRRQSLRGKSVVVVAYRDIAKALPKTIAQHRSQSTRIAINSQVLSIQMLPAPPEVLNPPIELTFNIDKKNEFALNFESHCSFWKQAENGMPGGWSTNGCVTTSANDTTVQCSCSHLTNFAILMSPIETPLEHQRALTIISLTGCCVSIVCLIITLIIHLSYWRFLKSERNVIAMTVCVSLLVSYLLFVFGVESTSDKGVCTTVAVLLHYTFLLVFFLLLAEGIYMALHLVLPFHKKSHLKQLLIGAFVVPAVVVVIVASATQLHGYGNDKYCWLTVNSVAFWMFVGPLLLVIIFNLTIIILIIKKIHDTKLIKDMNQHDQAKTFVSKTLMLLPLMGVTWVFGIFSVHESAVWLQYLFVLFNSFQGLFIFFFHCVLNRQLRSALAKSNKPFATHFEESSRGRPATDQHTDQTRYSNIEPQFTVMSDVCTAHGTPASVADTEKEADQPTSLTEKESQLAGRLRNMTHAVTSRVNKAFSSSQQYTVTFSTPHDDQIHIQDKEKAVEVDMIAFDCNESKGHKESKEGKSKGIDNGLGGVIDEDEVILEGSGIN